MAHKKYWVGIVSKDAPDGNGEDYRSYVQVNDDDDEHVAHEKINLAVMKWAQYVSLDGSAVAVKFCGEVNHKDPRSIEDLRQQFRLTEIHRHG